MPWSSNRDLPKSIRTSLPDEAQTTWRHIANAAIQEYKTDESRALATAWAGLRRAGWQKSKDGKWIKEVKKEEPTCSSVHVPVPLGTKRKSYDFNIQKANIEKQLAFGWAMLSSTRDGTPVVDHQKDMIDEADLEDLAYKFVRLYREAGEMHLRGGVGELVESVVFTKEKQALMGVPGGYLPVGWWVGFYISDSTVWEAVKNGTYKAFSIEGTAKREPV